MIIAIYKDLKITNFAGGGYYTGYLELDYNLWHFLWEEMCDWCTENITGEQMERWHMSGNKFLFANEDDMMLFAMRWS